MKEAKRVPNMENESMENESTKNTSVSDILNLCSAAADIDFATDDCGISDEMDDELMEDWESKDQSSN